LLAIALRALVEGEHETRARLWRALELAAAGAIAFKILFTGLFFGKAIATSRADVQALLVLGVVLGLIAVARRLPRVAKTATVGLFVIAAADLLDYNLTLSDVVTQPNWVSPLVRKAVARPEPARVDPFRVPFLYFFQLRETSTLEIDALAYSESIFRVRGAMSRGNNHQFMTTKRFYDYFTNVPLATQLVTSSIVEPMVRFVPRAQARELDDRRAVLAELRRAPPEQLAHELLLETREAQPVPGTRPGTLDDLPEPEAPDLPALLRWYQAGRADVRRRKDLRRAEWDRQAGRPIGDVTSDSPNRLAVSVDADEDGYLFVGDGWSRHWRATENGAPLALRVANYNGKAVFLAKGRHRVQFEYRPVPYLRSVVAFHAGLALLVFALAVALVPLRRGAAG
jgi:hypothetical protein